jgi:hypothetical protein
VKSACEVTAGEPSDDYGGSDGRRVERWRPTVYASYIIHLYVSHVQKASGVDCHVHGASLLIRHYQQPEQEGQLDYPCGHVVSQAATLYTQSLLAS